MSNSRRAWGEKKLTNYSMYTLGLTSNEFQHGLVWLRILLEPWVIKFPKEHPGILNLETINLAVKCRNHNQVHKHSFHLFSGPCFFSQLYQVPTKQKDLLSISNKELSEARCGSTHAPPVLGGRNSTEESLRLAWSVVFPRPARYTARS